MSSPLFTVKKGAKLPSIVLTLTSTAVFDLTTATSVNFVYQKEGVAGRTSIPLTVLTTTTARLDVTDALVATYGTFECQVEAVFAAGTMIFPQLGFYEFQVTPTIE